MLTKHGLGTGSPQKCDEPITSLWFDPPFDRLVTGDASGTVRVVTNATGTSDELRSGQNEGNVHSGLVLNDMLRRNDEKVVRTHTILDEDDEDDEEPEEQAV